MAANAVLIRRLVPTLVDSAAVGAGSDVVLLGSVCNDAFFRGASVNGTTVQLHDITLISTEQGWV